MTEPVEISFFLEGRIIAIERFEEEISPFFAERSSFILWFRNDPEKFRLAKIVSFHHANMIFHGCTYETAVEEKVKGLRDDILKMKSQ